jgi:selenocysteine-specific elongation factor
MTDALSLGILGHVDHGKTALVRALTGIETDRLKEELERGLSIVLGFAYIETGHGDIELIDVPGHEDFVRAMIGGATALDGIVLCVAANEGVKPQTVEHFNIAQLLGIDRGVVVVTKTDLVDAPTLAAVRAELDGYLEGSFLDGADVFETSVTLGKGIDAVREALTAMTAAPVERDAAGPFFLPLDRSFTMHGFGQVVTGTLRRGQLRVGDTVEMQPSGRSATVRALQNHGRPVDHAVPGQRVAVNLRHVDRDELRRGDVLAAPGSITPTSRLDAELRLLPDAVRAIGNGGTLRFLTGTAEAMAKIRLLDRRELLPGDRAMVQFNLDRKIATRPSEPFLIRSASPPHTIGGGRILDVNAKRHRRFDAGVTQRLETAATGDLALIAARRLEEAGCEGLRLDALARELGIGRDGLSDSIARLGAIAIDPDLAVASAAYDALLNEILTAIERFHNEQPYRNGIDAGSLVSALESHPAAEVLRHALRHLGERERIRSVNGALCLTGHDPLARLGERERQLADSIERTFLDGGLEPPLPQAVHGGDRAKQILFRLLLETGRLVRLRAYDRDSERVLHASVLEAAKRAIGQKYPSPAAFAIKDVRDLLGSTRKYILPLMEHLDTTGATVRSGDLRRLRDS